MNRSANALPRLLIALAAASACLTARAAEPDLNLLVEHDVSEVGADGVTRTMHFQERIYRRENLVWIERVLPEGAHRPEAHAGGGAEHKHLDLAAAARWITLEAGRVVRVRLVVAHDRAVVEVPAAEYGNIGFDGSWENAYHLLDPRRLQAMKPATGEAPAGARWYQATGGRQTVRVLWDERARIPRRVESSDAAGTSRARMSAREVAGPSTPPWSALGGYQQKVYSDYLD